MSKYKRTEMYVLYFLLLPKGNCSSVFILSDFVYILSNRYMQTAFIT